MCPCCVSTPIATPCLRFLHSSSSVCQTGPSADAQSPSVAQQRSWLTWYHCTGCSDKCCMIQNSPGTVSVPRSASSLWNSMPPRPSAVQLQRGRAADEGGRERLQSLPRKPERPKAFSSLPAINGLAQSRGIASRPCNSPAPASDLTLDALEFACEAIETPGLDTPPRDRPGRMHSPEAESSSSVDGDDWHITPAPSHTGNLIERTSPPPPFAQQSPRTAWHNQAEELLHDAERWLQQRMDKSRVFQRAAQQHPIHIVAPADADDANSPCPGWFATAMQSRLAERSLRSSASPLLSSASSYPHSSGASPAQHMMMSAEECWPAAGQLLPAPSAPRASSSLSDMALSSTKPETCSTLGQIQTPPSPVLLDQARRNSPQSPSLRDIASSKVKAEASKIHVREAVNRFGL